MGRILLEITVPYFLFNKNIFLCQCVGCAELARRIDREMMRFVLLSASYGFSNKARYAPSCRYQSVNTSSE